MFIDQNSIFSHRCNKVKTLAKINSVNESRFCSWIKQESIDKTTWRWDTRFSILARQPALHWNIEFAVVVFASRFHYVESHEVYLLLIGGVTRFNQVLTARKVGFWLLFIEAPVANEGKVLSENLRASEALHLFTHPAEFRGFLVQKVHSSRELIAYANVERVASSLRTICLFNFHKHGMTHCQTHRSFHIHPAKAPRVLKVRSVPYWFIHIL